MQLIVLGAPFRPKSGNRAAMHLKQRMNLRSGLIFHTSKRHFVESDFVGLKLRAQRVLRVEATAPECHGDFFRQNAFGLGKKDFDIACRD